MNQIAGVVPESTDWPLAARRDDWFDAVRSRLLCKCVEQLHYQHYSAALCSVRIMDAEHAADGRWHWPAIRRGGDEGGARVAF